MTIRLLLGGSVPPEWGGRTAGGVASVHRILIEEIQSLDRLHDIEIAGLIPFNLAPASLRKPPVPVLFKPGQAASEPDFYRQAVLATRPDVIMFQHVAHRWAVYHGRLGIPVPAVGVVHSWHQLTFAPDETRTRIRRGIEEALTNLTALVFVSSQTLTEGRQLGLPYPALTAVINNPLGQAYVETELTHPRRCGWVFVGSLIERKNPTLVLEAAARCQRRLMFVGEGPMEAQLRSLAAKQGVADRVRFMGRVPQETVRQCLRESELLCMPSSSEGFSMAYLEALACGTPVVGAAANVRELNNRLGMTCGAPVQGDSLDEVVTWSRWVEDQVWDRSELRRRTVQAFAPATVVPSYVSLLRRLAGPVLPTGQEG